MPKKTPDTSDPLKPVDYLKQQQPGKPIAEVLANVFRQRIMDGEYLPGTRMVETEITELYGVSRGPVREAFRKLIADGLLETQKHKSPVVRGVDKERFAQMFQVRAVLEGLAARLVAARSTHKSVRAIMTKELDLWQTMDLDDALGFVSANTAFHTLMRDHCANQVLQEEIDRLAIPGFKAVFAPTATRKDVAASVKEHSAVLSAVLDGDGAKAERHMVKHVEASAVRVIANYTDTLFDRRRRELARLKGTDGV
ncbi:MAG: GntR family transcriptional regulator [Pseudomonadota bacterium]